jgi:hypothetical protein
MGLKCRKVAGTGILGFIIYNETKISRDIWSDNLG